MFDVSGYLPLHPSMVENQLLVEVGLYHVFFFFFVFLNSKGYFMNTYFFQFWDDYHLYIPHEMDNHKP